MSAELFQIAVATAGIPKFACLPGCSACCGPVVMSRLEWERICERLGCTPRGADDTLDCPMLQGGRCSVYDIRPAICRLYGAVEDLRCPHGCQPNSGLLSSQAARGILDRLDAISG